jgi:hypothetical protein
VTLAAEAAGRSDLRNWVRPAQHRFGALNSPVGYPAMRGNTIACTEHPLKMKRAELPDRRQIL